MESDYAIIGGGIVGLALAYGLLNTGKRVQLFDEGDLAFRASRGNFGLVWVQGKGITNPDYARWTQTSAAAWPGFAESLQAQTGVDVVLRQDGGFDYHLDEQSLEDKADLYENLKTKLAGDYPFEILRHNQLKREEPHIGHAVAGAILHHRDGHVNPLNLLRALTLAVRRLGARVHVGCKIKSVRAQDGGYRLTAIGGQGFSAAKVVVSAGLGAIELAKDFGFGDHVRPPRGQVLITEKLPPIMHRPSGTLRQVDDGGIQIGASAEEVGFDDHETIAVTAALAREATEIYPILAKAKLIRSWAALRVMSDDGYPIYQQSEDYPGVFMVTCHSGVTLAAAHAGILPGWFESEPNGPDLSSFSLDRFDVSTPR